MEDDIILDMVLRDLDDSIENDYEGYKADTDKTYDKLFIEAGFRPVSAYHFSF